MIVFFRRLWSFIKPYWVRLLLGLVFGVLYGVSNGLLMVTIKFVVRLIFQGPTDISLANELSKAPHFLQPLVDLLVKLVPQISVPSSKAGLMMVVFAVPSVMLLRVACGYLNIYLMSWSATRAVADMRIQLFAHMQNLPMTFFNRSSTGDLISRVTSDTQALYGIISGAVSSMVRDPVSLISSLSLLLWIQPKLTLISVVIIPVCIVPIILYGKRASKSAMAIQSSISELVQLMHESFTGSRIIKAYNLENAMVGRFRQTCSKNSSQAMRTLRAMEMPSQMMEFVGAVGVALVLVCLIFQDSRPKVDEFVMFIGGIFLMYQPFKSLVRLHSQLTQAAAASQRIFELLATPNSMPEPAQPKLLHAGGAEIHFDHIDFNYGEKPVLCGVDLRIQPGQLVALVGLSGSGKTTLANLLLRFYDPVKGCVRIGGIDIREFTTRDLRNQIAVVTQETVLFNETIRCNIELGRPGAKTEEIIAAAKHAYAHDFIVNKPQGYDTVVGEKGVMLSGGQRQRIAIARAVLRDAPILILDEATSALDTESERAVQEALDELMKGRTTICIAHRLSTIMHADVIVVLDQGRVVEMGKHAELLQRGGTYQKLYDMQFRE